MSTDKDQQLAKLFFESGLSHLKLHDYLNAEQCFKQAYDILPNRPSILINYAASLIKFEKWSECEKICRELLAIDPENLEGNLNLGICQVNKYEPESAIKFFDKVLRIDENYLPALINKANALQDVFKPEEALLNYQKVLSINPKSEEALIGLGNIQIHFKYYDLALQSLNTALEINPENPQALCNKGMLLIRMGKYSEGWRLYEYRWDIPGGKKNYPKLKIPACTTLGQLRDKTLAIIAEQGFGDSIQFCRFLPVLLENCTNLKIVFITPKPLASLFASLNSNVEILINNQFSIERINNCDYFLPLLSLPHLLNIKNPSEYNHTPYLYPSHDKRQWWLKRLHSKHTSPKLYRIGITWSGSGKYASQRNTRRDLPLHVVKHLLNTFASKNIEFHCLHKEFRHGEIGSLGSTKNLFFHDSFLSTFEDTASLMCAMDLIISIDTSIAHLAGALNLKHLLLLPDPPDFLSPISGDSTPWYESTKIIRQIKENEWGSVTNEAIAYIDVLLSK